MTFIDEKTKEKAYLNILEDILGIRFNSIQDDIADVVFEFKCYSDHIWSYYFEDSKTIYELNICVNDKCESFFDEEDLWELFCKKEITFLDYTTYHSDSERRIKNELIFRQEEPVI